MSRSLAPTNASAMMDALSLSASEQRAAVAAATGAPSSSGADKDVTVFTPPLRDAASTSAGVQGDAGTDPYTALSAGMFSTLPVAGTPVTSAFVIVTQKELDTQPAVAANVRSLAAEVPMLRMLVAKRLTSLTDASIPVTPRLAYHIQAGERHTHYDVNTLGAVGCADSHVRILKHIAGEVARGAVAPSGWTLICESDATPARAAWNAFYHSHARVDDDADVSMLVLGYDPKYAPESTPAAGLHGAFWNVPARPWQGTYALLVRNRCAAAIATAVLPLDCHFDAALSFAALTGAIPPIWLARMVLVQEMVGRVSTIQLKQLQLKTHVPASDVACSALIITPYVIAMVLFIVLLCVAIAQASMKAKLSAATASAKTPGTAARS